MGPKLRKDQRFFSMWELPPLLEVDTDTVNDVSGPSEGSQGSLSPANMSSGVTSCSEAWSEVSALLSDPAPVNVKSMRLLPTGRHFERLFGFRPS